MNQFPDGIRESKALKLVSDNGSQSTSNTFEKHCKLLGIEQKFTSYSNPKGNADTERMKLLLARTENNRRRPGICQ